MAPSPSTAATTTGTAQPRHKSQKSDAKSQQRKELDERVKNEKLEILRSIHLVPLSLVLTVLVCSGLMWILAFRDLMATGRSIGGPFGGMDDAMLEFTKATQFFDDSKGWKSQQGGLSTIASVTTDANNMGGLFIHKVGGAAALTVQSQKILPLVFQSYDVHWSSGHFDPMLCSAVLGNLMIAGFYVSYVDDLKSGGAGELGLGIVTLSILEAIVMMAFLVLPRRRVVEKSATSKKSDDKSPNSVPSRIVLRTVMIVSGVITFIAGRDLLFPGVIVDIIPRDDIYLEWTGALIHSPPPLTVEEEEHGMEAPLHIGEKFVHQLMALNVLICCVAKFISAFFVRTGKNRSGEIKSKVIWKVQAVGDALLLFIFRLFVASAKSASLDLRWHLMSIGYETFILGLNAFW